MPRGDERTVAAAFATQVAETPARLALQDGAREYTYKQLDQQANRLAHAILARAGEHEEPVAILLDHSAEAVVAILATIKAGKIKVVLDRDAPALRLRETAQHAGARLVVTDGGGAAAASELGIDVVRLDRLPGDLPDADPEIEIDENGVFGLVYTSGSAGEPKAVVIGQQTAYKPPRHAPSGPERIALVGGLSFAAARGVEGTLTSGDSLHLYDLRRRGIAGLGPWLEQERITRAGVLTSTLRAFLDELPEGPGFPDLRVFWTGGEALRRADVERFRSRFHAGCTLHYAYGVTESGAGTRLMISRDLHLDQDLVPAGLPSPDAEIRLRDVDRDGVGEITIRSRYVALGYWRDPELTATHFETDPSDPAVRAFHTGDRGRFRPDGMLEVLARADDRVKVRGYRIDLAEVELAVSGLPGVARAVVADVPRRGEARLVAYYVPSGPASTATRLRRALRERLPPYLIPAAFVPVESLPLTATGKVDRRALPPPPSDRPALEVRYEKPRDELERTLARIWEGVLDVAPVGIRDGFYDLGGDSLAAAKVKIRIGEELDDEVPLAIFAEGSATVAGLADAMRTRRSAALQPVAALQPEGSAPPVFCVHGLGGEILDLRDLAALLAPDRPFYGLQLIGPEADRAVRSVPALAAYYLGLVQRARPTGPLVVAGYSTGGVCAFELAQQLATAGRSPAALVLLDAPGPSVLRQLESARAPWKGRLLAVDLRSALHGRLPERWLDAAVDLGVRLGLPASHRTRQAYRIRAGRRAALRHRPKPYPGPVAVLRTDALQAPGALGWEPFVDGRLEVSRVSGDHHSMLMQPHVRTLASELRLVLTRLGPRGKAARSGPSRETLVA